MPLNSELVMNKKDREADVLSKRIWRLFASVRLAIVLFIVISASSIIGTVVIQNATAETTLKSLEKVIGHSLAEKAYLLVEKLGLTDMYSSWWFVAFLSLFVINIAVCSIDRLPAVWKIIKQPLRPLPETSIAAIEIKKEITLKKDIKNLIPIAAETLRKNGYKNISEHTGDVTQLLAGKNKYSRLGVYVVHVSVILILLGALFNSMFGFKGYVNILEGESIDTVTLWNKREKKLDFSIRCNEFDAEFFGNTSRAKLYKSSLSILENNKEIMTRDIIVNEPLEYKGIKIYQTSYGFYFRKDADYVLRLASPKSGSQTVKLKYTDAFIIPGTDITGKISDFNPSFAINPMTDKPYIREMNMSNPAVFIEFYEKGKLRHAQWIFKRNQNSGKIFGGNTVEFLDLWGVQYTGLQVNKMPGLPVIYFGFLVLSIGLYIVFFMSHKKIWVLLSSQSNSHTRIVIAGIAHNKSETFRRQIDKIAYSLSNSFKA